MLYAALVFVLIAIAIHVYIFWLEAFAWTKPRGIATFRMSQDQANASKPLAFNQGFYNLFLAVVAAIGAALILADQVAVGAALVFAGAGSMVAAGLVLLISSPAMARAAFLQLTAPALGIVLLLIAVI